MLNIHRHDHSSSDMSFEQCKLNPQSANLCTTDTTPDMAQKYLSLKSHLIPPVSNMHCKSFFLHIDDSLQLVVFSFWIDILQCEEFQSNLSHNFYGSKATVVVVQHCITLVGMLFSRVLYTILEMILKWNLVINFEAQTSSIRAIAPQLCGGEDVFTLYWQSQRYYSAVNRNENCFSLCTHQKRYRYYFSSYINIFLFIFRNKKSWLQNESEKLC